MKTCENIEFRRNTYIIPAQPKGLISVPIRYPPGVSESTVSDVMSVRGTNGTPPRTLNLGGVTKTITSYEDLNSFTTKGVTYNCPGGAIATSLQHRPANLVESFTLFYLAGIPTQIIITTWGEFKMYKRTMDGNEWHKWQLITGTEVEYAT